MAKIKPLDKRILIARAVESYCRLLLENEEGEDVRAEYNTLVSFLKKTEKFVKKKKGEFSTELEKQTQKQWKRRFKDMSDDDDNNEEEQQGGSDSDDGGEGDEDPEDNDED